MTSKRKFFRTVVTIEILSEDEPFDTDDLGAIAGAIDSGPCSGSVKVVSVDEVDGGHMAKLLQEQASDPEFFQLDSEGNDLEEGV
jgi:hypothetical protein